MGVTIIDENGHSFVDFVDGPDAAILKRNALDAGALWRFEVIRAGFFAN